MNLKENLKKKVFKGVIKSLKINYSKIQSITWKYLNENYQEPKLIEFLRESGKRESIRYLRIVIDLKYPLNKIRDNTEKE